MEYEQTGPHRGVKNLFRFEVAELRNRLGEEYIEQYHSELRDVDWDALEAALVAAGEAVILEGRN